MWIGINHHPIHEIPATDLERFDTVRFPTWVTMDKVRLYQKFIKDTQEFNGRPLVVIDSNSITKGVPLEQAIERLLKRYPTVEYWQIGNEPDQKGSESSWYMTPQDYRHLLEVATSVLKNKTLLSAGFVSGDVNYLRQLSYYPFDKLCIHPYGIFPWSYNQNWYGQGFGDIKEVIQRYQNVVNKPVWITEFGMPLGAFNSAAGRQLYYEDMLNAMDVYGVEAALPYCWTDCQCNELSIKGEVTI